MIRLDIKATVLVLIVLIPALQPALRAQQDTSPQEWHMADEIRSLWSWSSSNQSRFCNLEQERENLVPELVEHLRLLSPNLTIEFEAPKNGVREMAISADGVEKDFPLVEQLVAAAPTMQGWHVVAFRQPSKIQGMELKYPGITLDTDRMWMMPIEDDQGFDLIVFFPNYSDDRRNLFINATYVLLDNAIGEYNVVKGIRTLDFQKLPPVGDRRGILPFVDLPKVFATYQAKHHR